jgi:5-methylcytosine-specific restriction protein A
LYRQAPSRNRALAHELQSIYRGRCQICRWDPRDTYGESLCHAHHIHWLSRGGPDRLDNLMLLCPNHHEAVHRCDAQLDFRAKHFDFQSHTERITLNEHLPLWDG